jgi:tetratricopeptide (TPR) repeat protein
MRGKVFAVVLSWVRKFCRTKVTVCPEPTQFLQIARCALLAGQWQQAADTYSEANVSAPADFYHAGFAQVKLGDTIACLRLWQQLDCTHPDFIVQKEQVSLLLIEELHCRLDKNPLTQETEVRQLLEEFSLAYLPSGGGLLTRCRSLRLARLWQKEELEEILVAADETDWLQSTALAVQAKAACQLMMEADITVPTAQARHFINCWLSLLFHPEAGPQSEPQRQALLDFGADVLRRQAAQQLNNGGSLLRQWEEELALLLRMSRIAAMPIFTPALSLRAKIADQLFALIQKSRDAFADSSEWMAAGAVYSPAAQTLLLVREGDCDGAMDTLVELEEVDDPFVAWGAAQVRTACGLHYLSSGQCRKAEQILINGPAHWTAELEKQLLTAIEQDDNQDGTALAACLGILALLPEDTETGAVFCSSLTNQVVRLRSSEEASPKLLAAAMRKAVALNPNDDFAQMIFDQVRRDLALTEIGEAFDRDCFAEAARIATASRFPQAVEQFFETARQVAARIERGDYADQEAAVFTLKELLESVSSVDSSHGAVRRIRRVLDGLRIEARHESL